jgi:hypothetical protein
MTQFQILWSGMRATWRLLNAKSRVLVVAVPIVFLCVVGGAASVARPSRVSTVVDRSETQALEQKLKETTAELDTTQKQLAVRQYPVTKWRTRTVTVYAPPIPGQAQTVQSVSVTQSGEKNEGSQSVSSSENRDVKSTANAEDVKERETDADKERTTVAVSSGGPLFFAGAGYAPFQSDRGLQLAIGASAHLFWKLEIGGLVVVPTAQLQGTTPFLTLGIRP